MQHTKVLSPVHKLDFNDVLIVPQKSNVVSRSQVNLTRSFTFPNSKQKWTGVPIISSNMDTVTNIDTFNTLKKRNYLSCFPKYLNRSWLSVHVPVELEHVDWYMISCGINDGDTSVLFKLFQKLSNSGIRPKFVCIDVANGYMNELIKTCSYIRTLMPEVTIVAGNVVTPEGVKELVLNGSVDIVKVGIGSGLLCTTRKITGVGYPQLSAVLECSEEAHSHGAYVISDGGIAIEGDVAKAFCAGGDFVMLGSMLAGHDISPGECITENGKKYKLAYGMSSSIANQKYAGGLQWYKAPEGKVVKMPFKGPLNNTLQRIEGGIRSACTYIGAESIEQMSEKGKFVLVHRQYNNTLDQFVVSE